MFAFILQVSVEVPAAAKEVGATFVDAPVSGGVNAAAAGTLTFMVNKKFEAMKPMFHIYFIVLFKIFYYLKQYFITNYKQLK